MSLWAAHNVDVVVNFGRLDYLWALLKIQIPILCRFGNPVTQSQLDWILAQRRLGVRFIGISKHQMAGLVPQELIDIVHNGTDVQKFQFSDGPQIKPYLAFLGRITPNKGADTAIRVARSSGMKLKIAGNISDEKGGREFFEQTIKPQLGSHIEWLGPVDDMAKQRLLGNASALLFPIRWPEPFGIVMAESLACGTPILATRCASTPEVIDHGVTGFLCDSEGDMVAAVKQLPTIDRSTCRRVAEERFSVPIMAQGYLDAIERLMRDGSKAKMLAV
jgi:glycosyltransferase involved in cell wall biosynthesis